MSGDLESIDYALQYQLMKSMMRPFGDSNDIKNLALEERCIDLTTSCVLNATTEFGNLQNVIISRKGDDALVSDVDQQLILKFFFKEPVSIKHITFRADNKPSISDVSAPRIIKMYANRPEFDFSEADSVEPDQVIELKPQEEASVDKVNLRGTKFAHVKSMQVFVVENMDDSLQTFINEIGIWGNVHPNYRSDHLY
ncbi:conserved hypothetical protein [Theileria equi strain WA]|uniref:PITH domain-containing protein n=1 Tax=Theileria equi strain WA TaxID=1537102 RepID=L1LC16_THEEQ|nr:conserved hypothetical protein [Theileria equi strain WA]EKX72881.1 conserved hypothetical protein [Theileria equi strain WA]|eukprot:XP_004832333.1 conserved hypothetical protein [Theileria equi strain WA]